MSAAENATTGNLPVQLTPFVGREEIKRTVVQQLLREDVRLLTLVGPPGIGKTRLSLEVVPEIARHFRDGVRFVALAPVTNPALVASTIAQAIGLKQASGRLLTEILAGYLREKNLLLVLDNFEQVVEAAPLVAELLAAAPLVKALVTSREALRVRGEQEFAVPPLNLPNLNKLPSAEQVSNIEAVQLFAQRARSANLDFRITDENALVIAAICWRLDGLPLALELAAARTKLLPPQALFERLGQRLHLLTGGARDLPARHRTLRNAIDWSYNLLDEDERKLFRRMGIFVGGCSWEAVEVVGNADGSIALGTLETLSALVDKSLVQRTQRSETGEPRLMMLETLKEYALDQLEESGEADEIRRQHARYFLKLAEEGASKIGGQEGAQWLRRLDDEIDNLRAALKWGRDEAQEEGSEAELVMRLAVGLGQFWYVRGYTNEGRDWQQSILSLPGAQKPTPLRARMLLQSIQLAYVQCDYRAARATAEECIALCRSIGYESGVGHGLQFLGEIATEEGDYEAAPRLFEECLVILRKAGEIRATASALGNLGYVALRTGNYEAAFAPFEEALQLYTQLGDKRGIGFQLTGIGEAAMRLGNYKLAEAKFRETHALRLELGDKWGLSIAVASQGWIALLQRDYGGAIKHLNESIKLRREIGDIGGQAWCLEKLADVAREQHQHEHAIRLLGAAAALRSSVGSVIDPADLPEHERNLAAMRRQLGEEAFTKAWAEGSSMTMDALLEAAPKAKAEPPAKPDPEQTLTRREFEVATLISQSKSNAEIAEKLVVSKRTVETHIANILSKLNFTSRGQIAAWAIRRTIDDRR